MVFCSNNAEVIILCCDCPLFQIGTETEAARDLSEKSLSVLQDLKKRLEALRKRYFENELDITNAEDTINKAEIAAEAAERVSDTV